MTEINSLESNLIILLTKENWSNVNQETSLENLFKCNQILENMDQMLKPIEMSDFLEYNQNNGESLDELMKVVDEICPYLKQNKLFSLSQTSIIEGTNISKGSGVYANQTIDQGEEMTKQFSYMYILTLLPI